MINPLLGPFRCLWSVLYLYFGWTTTEFVWKWTKTHLFKGLSACLVHTMVQMANEWDSSSIYTFVLSDCRTSQTLHFCVLFVLLSNNTYETNIQYTVGVLWARSTMSVFHHVKFLCWCFELTAKMCLILQ